MMDAEAYSLTERGSDVLVIGGGVIGCSVAWKLAERGHRVMVVERGTPGRGATWAAGGMLAPLSETAHDDALHRLAVSSMDRWAAFADALGERSGIDVEYHPAGKLHIAFDDDEAGHLRELAARGAGFGVQRLSGEDARRLEPSLSPAVHMAVLVGRDHRVNNRRLADAVWKAAEAEGVEFRLGVAARSIEVTGGSCPRFEALRLEDGTRIAANAVIVAAGAWSGLLEGLGKVPVEPVRGQMFAVDVPAGTGPAAGALLDRVIEASGCYIIPRNSGRVLVGATAERVGFQPGPTPAGLRSLIEPAVRAVPALADLPIVESWAGYRPATADGLPILGPDPGVAGVWYATGHFRNGILLAPITADLIAAAVSGDGPAADLAPFRSDRLPLRSPRPEHAHHVPVDE